MNGNLTFAVNVMLNLSIIYATSEMMRAIILEWRHGDTLKLSAMLRPVLRRYSCIYSVYLL